MGTDEAKAIYKQRRRHRRTRQPPDARPRPPPVVRGAEKAKAVFLWHALAHNMARLWSLKPA
jgi:hypothetical protein